MDRVTMVNTTRILSVLFWLFAGLGLAQEEHAEAITKPSKTTAPPLTLPYERPIGFTLNAGGLASMTFEGRFILGLFPHVLFVASPSYQNTPEIPFFHLERKERSLFDIKRFNMGLGLRAHFYEYDSWDGFYIEGMGRGGITWVGKDPSLWSIIPSLIFGYSAVYDSGYTASFGLGLEWEFLLGKSKSEDVQTEVFRTAYFGVTKIPLTGELSIGWTW